MISIGSSVKYALCIGSAACVYDDDRAVQAIARDAGVEFDLVIACNEIGIRWPRITDWVTLHGEFFREWQDKRAALGLNTDYHTAAAHRPKQRTPPRIDFTMKDWGGSSGLFTVQRACMLGAERIVCIGIPMTKSPHFNKAEPWQDVDTFRMAWKRCRHEYAANTCSMSGWTAERLGKPTVEWLQGAEKPTMWAGVGDAADGSSSLDRRRRRGR